MCIRGGTGHQNIGQPGKHAISPRGNVEPRNELRWEGIGVQLCHSAYGDIYVLPNDTPRGRMLCATGVAPDHADIERLSAYLHRGSIAVDAGANFGCFALAFAAAGAIVYAFEPQQEIAKLLSRSVYLAVTQGRRASVLVFPVALGAAAGTIMMPEIDYASEMDFGTVRPGGAGTAAEMWKLDALMLPRLDVLKIDVEGMELEVLAGAEKTIRNCRPLIFAEFSVVGETALADKLRDLGYTRIDKGERDLLALP